MAEKIADGIYKLNIPLPRNPLKNLNSYLICGQDRNLLIDTGFNIPDCLNTMKAELGQLSIDMNKTDIFLTHMHADHSGLAPVLASEYSKTYISSIDAAILKLPKLPEARERLVAMYVSEGYPYKAFMESFGGNSSRHMVSVDPMDCICLEDGHILSYGGYELLCILTPGHTPGHMCLYCDGLKMMFLGDHVLFGITPNIIRWLGFENSLKNYLSNLQKIGQYDIKNALPAHRSVDCTVADRIRTITEHHHKRLDEVLSILKNNKGITAYNVASRMYWDIQCDSWEEFPPTQKWFAVGEALAHIDYLLDTGDISFEDYGGIRRYYPK